MTTTLLRAIADLELSLAAAVTAGSTTATLASASDDDGVALPSGLYGFTIDRLTDSKEYIVCNLSGTALTNIVSISKQGASATGFSTYHRKNATVEITDWAILKRILSNLDGTTGFDSGTNLGYDGAPAGLTGNQFATVNYVLSVVNGGTVSYDQQVATSQTLGETISVNDLVYLKAADGRWWKVAAGDTTTFAGLRLGFSKTAGNAGSSATIAISGPVSDFTSLTAGVRYYASNTGGAVTTSATQTYTVPIGWALSTTSILLTPFNTNLDVYRGSTESSANSILTSNALVSTPTDQTQTTQDTSATVGEADSTTKHNQLAQSFIVGTSIRRIRGVALYKSADTGSFTGTVTVSLQADSAGAPSGSSLASVVTSNASWLALGTGPQNFIFSSEYTSLVPGSTYWIVISTSTSDTSNHPNIGAAAAGGYANGSVKYKNTTDGWVAIATIDLYFKTFLGQVGNIPGGDANGTIPAEVLPSTSPVVRVYTANGSWSKPTASNFRYVKVRVQAGGTGGSGINTAGGIGAGGVGGNSNFGTQVNSNGTGADLAIPGQAGAATSVIATGSVWPGRGGDSVLGFGGLSTASNADTAGPAGANYGGAGAGGHKSSSTGGASGGAGGNYAEKLVAASALNVTEAVTVGVGGTAGDPGGAGNVAGGVGAQGVVIVEEYYGC